MAVKKFYSNKAKPGWLENPNYKPKYKPKKGENADEFLKKYYSWGFDIDLEPVEWDEFGKPKRNRRRESGFKDYKTANAAVGRIRLAEKNSRYDLNENKLIYPLLSDLFQKRLNDITDRAEKVRALRVFQFLLDALFDEGYQKIRLNELKTAHLNFYIKYRRKSEVKDSTIKREMKPISSALNQAVNYYPEIENFVVPKMPDLKVPKTRRETVLQSIEVEAIVSELMKSRLAEESQAGYLSRQRAGLLFALSSVTGARPGELVALRETDILLDLNVLRITGTKTRFQTAKTVRYFPLIQIVRSILIKALELKFAEYIFARNGTLTGTYYDAVKTACTNCGFKYGRKTPGGIIPYDLRHTATTLLMQSGADFETVKSITGQSQATLWHYTHANKNSIERAVSVLENFAEKSLEKATIGRSSDTNKEDEILKYLLATNRN
ncbi:MAG: tyrosine-type recombinase/integrase [Pyrinomonadaceae bacterium]|nr:tyrosine-type recombinase/integrase [Pyrinomonadaceae bacterium]